MLCRSCGSDLVLGLGGLNGRHVTGGFTTNIARPFQVALDLFAALLAARHVGVPLEQGMAVLARFENVKRRLELRGTVAGISVFDDFAHHPTAIATTVAGLRRRVGSGVDAPRILAVLEPRSNTMKPLSRIDTCAGMSLRSASLNLRP